MRLGFSLIYPIRDMRIFSPEELVLLFGNADEDWSPESEFLRVVAGSSQLTSSY